MTTAEPSCRDEHKTLECVCQRCSHNVDAICPQCRSELGPDSPVEDHGYRPATPQQLLAKFAELARFIQSKRNSKFWWGCFLIATGDAAADGVSMQDFGREWSVTRACVSKTCVEICVRLGIPPSRYMRSEEAREKYQESNRRPVKL